MILIFSIKITFISLDKKNFSNLENQKTNFSLLRRDIVDRNGVIISRNVHTFHAGINPNQVKDKKSFLFKLRFNFPDLPFENIKEKLNGKKYFRLKKGLIKMKRKNYGLWEKKQLSLSPFRQECIHMETYLAI